MNGFYWVFWSIVFLAMTSCNRGQANQTATSAPIEQSSNQILFLTLEAISDSVSGKVQMRIIQQDIVDGVLKSNSLQEVQQATGHWKVSLLNADGLEQTSLWLHHPLFFDAELADDTGKLYRTKVSLNKVEVPLRFPFHSGMQQIKVEELLEQEQWKTIYQSKLNQ